MSDAAFHIKKAERNNQYFDWCNQNTSTYNEWSIVIMFYICVHYVDAILNKDTTIDNNFREPADHRERNKAITKCKYLRVRATDYLNLYDRSRDARYNNIDFTDKYYNQIKTKTMNGLVKYLEEKSRL